MAFTLKLKFNNLGLQAPNKEKPLNPPYLSNRSKIFNTSIGSSKFTTFFIQKESMSYQTFGILLVRVFHFSNFFELASGEKIVAAYDHIELCKKIILLGFFLSDFIMQEI